jgi:hypothetical protein
MHPSPYPTHPQAVSAWRRLERALVRLDPGRLRHRRLRRPQRRPRPRRHGRAAVRRPPAGRAAGALELLMSVARTGLPHTSRTTAAEDRSATPAPKGEPDTPEHRAVQRKRQAQRLGDHAADCWNAPPRRRCATGQRAIPDVGADPCHLLAQGAQLALAQGPPSRCRPGRWASCGRRSDPGGCTPGDRDGCRPPRHQDGRPRRSRMPPGTRHRRCRTATRGRLGRLAAPAGIAGVTL